MTEQEKIKRIIVAAESKYNLAIKSLENHYINDANFYINEVLTTLDSVVFIEDNIDNNNEINKKACQLFRNAIALKKELKRIRIEEIRDKIR